MRRFSKVRGVAEAVMQLAALLPRRLALLLKTALTSASN
jgi:hypothetical protein